jgi:hypothetical protein
MVSMKKTNNAAIKVLTSFMIDPPRARSLWRKALATSERVAEQAALTSDALYDPSSKRLRATGSSLARLTDSGSACAPSSAAGKSTDAINTAGTSPGTPGVAVAKLK